MSRRSRGLSGEETSMRANVEIEDVGWRGGREWQAGTCTDKAGG